MIFQKCVSYFTLVVFVMVSTLVVSQTTVNIPCTGPSNPNSGRVTDGGSKSYGYLQWNNNVGGCPTCRASWARFDIGSYVPDCATITSVEVIFYVESKTFSSQQANRLRVFTGNPGTMNGTTLYNTITGANHHSYDNIPTGVNT